MSKHYTIGEVIEVRVEKIVPRGLGLAFTEDLTVFIPLTAPGDVLRVRLLEIKKRLAFAEIVEVKKGGPQRIAPPCEYFGTCGGCDFQQMSYAAQLDAKVGIVRDCLHRIGKIEYDAEIPIIPSPINPIFLCVRRDMSVCAWPERHPRPFSLRSNALVRNPEVYRNFKRYRVGMPPGSACRERSRLSSSRATCRL